MLMEVEGYGRSMPATRLEIFKVMQGKHLDFEIRAAPKYFWYRSL